MSGWLRVIRACNWVMPDTRKGRMTQNGAKRQGMLELGPRYSTSLGRRNDDVDTAALMSEHSVWSRPWLAEFVLRRTFKG